MTVGGLAPLGEILFIDLLDPCGALPTAGTAEQDRAASPKIFFMTFFRI
jgi:hypothetical protein